MTDRYWFDNALTEEAERLRLLEEIADPRSVDLLRQRVRPGWRCLELGAGAGSMAAWLAGKVGAQGSVVAVDRDTTLCRHLEGRPNVRVLECRLEDLDLPAESADLVHTRNVLMHVEHPERIVEAAIGALPSGGVAVFEEADYYPLLAGATSSVFARVAVPLVGRWTWARLLPSVVAGHPVDEIDVLVDAPMLHGGSAEAAFWTATFTSARSRLAVSPADFDEVIALLADPAFWTPFAAVVCVSARKK